MKRIVVLLALLLIPALLVAQEPPELFPVRPICDGSRLIGFEMIVPYAGHARVMLPMSGNPCEGQPKARPPAPRRQPSASSASPSV